MTNPPSESSAAKTATASWFRRAFRWFVRVAVIALVLAVVLVGGLLGWQEWRLSQAAQALDKGDAKYSLFLVSRILDLDPENTRARAIQARCLLALGNADDAIKIFDRIGAASAADMHAVAKALMVRQEWSAAQPMLEQVLQMSPNDPDALYENTSCLMRLGRFEEALEGAQLFAKVTGQVARADLIVGSIYGSMRDYTEAVKAFERVLEKEPEGKNLQVPPAEFFLRYGRVLMEVGKPQEALMPLKMSAAGQSNGEVFALLGDAASQLGKAENAVAAWKKAVEVDPNNAPARSALANAALLSGDGKQAKEWLEPMRNLKMSSGIAYLFQRTYTQLGDKDAAAEWQKKAADLRREESVLGALDRALLTDPGAFWSRAARAHYFASEGNWAQAELLVTQLLQEKPGEPFVIELADAVRRRSKLPDLTRIPITQF